MVELIWDGKYDEAGRRVPPLKIALPFQTVETVNESAQERQRQFDLFSSGRDPEWRNRLIWGDKKYVLPSLLPEFAGKVDLIYIDPPFDTGADFSFIAQIPDNPETGDESARFTKKPSMLEVKAYRDTWGQGLDTYVRWFFETSQILRELLSQTGSLYVHLDQHVSHYAKVVLDEVFGPECFLNEIIWKRTSAHSSAKRYGPVHDTLLYYGRAEETRWNGGQHEYDAEYVTSRFARGGERPWKDADLTASGVRRGSTGLPWRGFDVTAKGRHWAYPPEELDKLDLEGRIYWPKKVGGWPRLKKYLDESPGVQLQDVWTDVSPVNSQASERVAYATQKPEALLERILSASSDPGDLVLDCFAGSGTTAAVAEKLGRRWITADLGRFAIHTTRKRLLSIPDVKPFVVQNLGKYERQAWQAAEFGEAAEQRQQEYRNFILSLYHAEPAGSYRTLHGLKSGRWVHVGAVDSPVSTGDLTAISTELKQAGANKVDILGWDFAFNTNQDGKDLMTRAGIDARFHVIPREVLEKKAVEQGDIYFFELGALGIETQVTGKTVDLKLTDFIVRQDDIPQDVREHITHWSQMLDYWAVDWDYRGDSFHNQWQSYRTRKDPKLELGASHTYDEPGTYRVMVKAIDILGNDTTRVVEVTI